MDLTESCAACNAFCRSNEHSICQIITFSTKKPYQVSNHKIFQQKQAAESRAFQIRNPAHRQQHAFNLPQRTSPTSVLTYPSFHRLRGELGLPGTRIIPTSFKFFGTKAISVRIVEPQQFKNDMSLGDDPVLMDTDQYLSFDFEFLLNSASLYQHQFFARGAMGISGWRSHIDLHSKYVLGRFYPRSSPRVYICAAELTLLCTYAEAMHISRN